MRYFIYIYLCLYISFLILGPYYILDIIENKRINITGIAESNNRVSSLMRRLEASDWLASPNLDKVKADPKFGDQANKFELGVTVQAPALEEESGEG